MAHVNDGIKIPDKNKNLLFPKTIRHWDEALPLGNGLCGALIWGSSNELRFSLDRGDLWDTTPYSGIYKDDFSYPMMVKLAKDRNAHEIRRIFDAPYNQALPSKLPAGKLIFDFGCDSNVRSELSLLRAEANITIGQDIQIKSFLHARQAIGVIHINQPYSAMAFKIEQPRYGVEGEKVKENLNDDGPTRPSLEQLVYPAPEVVSNGNIRYFIQDIDKEFAYGVFAMVKESSKSIDIVYTIATSNDGPDWKERAKGELENALHQGYETLIQSHLKWWDEYWCRSSITVPSELFEKNWYLTQYFLASCSRKGAYPMPLQGVWTADDGALPPWKGDYHFDLNVQLTYSSYLKANHPEEGEVLMDYLWNMAEEGRRFARSFYHSKGLCLPSTMTINGQPLGGWGMYSLSPTNQLWTCQLMERHYRFTGDKDFLAEKAYPYMVETAEFILGLLEEREGKYYLPISSSPEIHDDNIESFVTPNSNYDLALMRYLFGALAELARELGNGTEEQWIQKLAHMPELAVNENGVFMLSPDEELGESHRHFSHAMAIHPLRLIPYEGDENRRIIDATVLDLERLGTGYWVGFSFAWMAAIYAVQRNGNGAAQQLETLWRNHCLPNGFHVNGDYRNRGTSTFHYSAFTLEANFCAADALQEMLLQSEDNNLHLFPAVPDEWMDETVSFTQFRAEKGLLVSASMKEGQVVSLTLKPRHSGSIYLKIDGKLSSFIAATNKQTVVNNNKIEIVLTEGKEYVF